MLLQKDMKNWLIQWFQERNPGILIDINDNYYAKGLIDSFGIVELISEIETVFDIVFDDDDLKSPDFRTINGLLKIIINHIRQGSTL